MGHILYRFRALAFVALASLGLSTVTASAVPISIFNTGVDAGGAVVADQTVGDLNYSLISVPSGTMVVKAITSASGFPIPPYISDSSLSRWIGPNTADLDGDPGDYIYRTTFDLTGLDPVSAVLTGRWAADDLGSDILINGTSTASAITGLGSFTTFSITSGFIAGINFLDFLVTNGPDPIGSSNNPTALRVEISGSANALSVVPLPAALPLYGTGLAFMGFIVWRRKRKVAVA